MSERSSREAYPRPEPTSSLKIGYDEPLWVTCLMCGIVASPFWLLVAYVIYSVVK